MKTLVITNDYSPKKGGISTYIKSFTENLDFETFVYAPNWAEGDNVIKSKYSFIFAGNRFVREINDIVNQKNIEIILQVEWEKKLVRLENL